MQRTFDLHVVDTRPLSPPLAVLTALPLGDAAADLVAQTRDRIRAIMQGRDRRLLVVVGPCSIHDPRAALEYAGRLAALRRELADELETVMRVYFEKPRTATGWKGFINDPRMDDSFHIEEGIWKAREFLMRVAEMGLPAGTEALDPITPQYLGELIAWTAIGARTSESQTHREMASGLSTPVGFKNATDGDLEVAINAILGIGMTFVILTGGIDLSVGSIVGLTGMIAGGLTLSAWGGFRRRMLTSMAGLAGMGLALSRVGFAPASLLPLAVAGMFLCGFCMPLVNGPLFAAIQATVAPEMQGRIFTLLMSASAAAAPLGLAVAGPVADGAGVGVWFLASGIVCVTLAAGSLFLPALMQLEDNNRAAAPQAADQGLDAGMVTQA